MYEYCCIMEFTRTLFLNGNTYFVGKTKGVDDPCVDDYMRPLVAICRLAMTTTIKELRYESGNN